MKPLFIFLGLLALLLLGAGTECRAQGAPQARTAVAVLWFENKTGDPKQAFWRYQVARRVEQQLAEVKALRLVSGEKFAARQVSVKEGAPLTAAQARRMGEIVEARRVVYGTYRRQGSAWTLSARVLNVATGKSSPELTGTAPDFYGAVDALDDKLFTQIGVLPSAAERIKIRRRGTKSAAALELFSRALEAQDANRPLTEAQAFLTSAIVEDRRFAEAYNGLSATYGSQGKFPEAADAVHKAIELYPDYAGAHLSLGVLLLLTGKYDEAVKELNEAHRLDPDDSASEERLGELGVVQEKLDDAVAHMREAARLDPFDSAIRASLGRVLVLKGDQRSALAELKEAERLDPEDINALQMMFLSFDMLKDTARAIDVGDRFVAVARKTGANQAIVAQFDERVRYLKSTLTPTFLDLPQPRSYTADQMQTALRSRLTPDEMKLVVNPIAEGSGMKAWAEELSRDAHGDLEKARALYEGLARRPDGKKKGSTRTAREVFALWKKPDESFNCQEYAKLYIALARSIGLKAFYVHLERDFENRVVYHDCAAVYVEGKAILVDLAYGWFGPNHKEHRVLDDVQAIAHQLYQSDGNKEALARCRIAVKLHPDFAWGMLALTHALIGEDQWDEASRALQSADQLEPNRWDAAQVRGMLAFHEEKWDLAQAYFKQTLAANPNDPVSFYYLGALYAQQGKLREALDAFRTSLRLDPPQTIAQSAGQFIAEINEKLAPVKPQE